MARKLVSLAQYEMQAAANKGGAKEMYNNSGWSVGNNAARRTGQRAAAGSSGKHTGGASARTAQSAGGTAQSQLLELYSAQQAALRAARRAAYETTVADQQRQYQQNLSRVNAAADQALREAYLNKMESLKGLNQALTAQGFSGGASETALAGLYNNYGSARSQIEAQRLEQQGNLLLIRYEGDGFLYNMVRIIAGTLIEVGSGRRRAEEMPDILASLDRGRAGFTAPPQGLFLWNVEY